MNESAEKQARLLIDEIFKAIAEQDEMINKMQESLSYVLRQEPSPMADVPKEGRSGSCELSEQLIRAIEKIDKNSRAIASICNRLEI